MADRFGVRNEGRGEARSVDLASGEEVLLLTSTAGGASDQMRWALRCDRFFRLRHRGIARLVDFGAYGEMRRFEAWRCGAAWRGAPGEAEGAQRTATVFLEGSGLTTGHLAPGSVHAHNGRPVVVPDGCCGYDISGFSRIVPLADCGIHLVCRPAVTAGAELFAQPSDARPRALALWGPPGAGVRSAMQQLARAARLQGFVPVWLPMLNPATAPAVAQAVVKMLDGRSLCLIVDSGPVAGWRGLVEWSLGHPHGHVVLFAGRQEVPHVDGLALDRVEAEALVDAIRPESLDVSTRRRVEQAAQRAKGIPGRFIQLLWGVNAVPNSRMVALGTKAAEHHVSYGEGTDRQSLLEIVPRPTNVEWPAAGELATLRRRATAAIRLLELGRHEPGSRALRQAIGGLARRHAWGDAARGGLALAKALLLRGRPQEAQAVLGEAREYVAHTDRDASLWIDAAVLAGVAWTDLARLDEALNVLHGAVASARESTDWFRSAEARLALARCLFWGGRYDEAHQTLASIESTDIAEALKVQVAIASSRIAVARGDPAAAVAGAAGALEAAERLAGPSAIARAANAAAFAHMVVGDRVAMERDIALCVRAARSAREPLCALRARLVGAEHVSRTGHTRAADALLGRIARIPVSHLPMTIRARCALLRDLLSASSSPADVVRRHTAATGLKALALFAPACTAGSQIAEHAVVTDILDILRCCQSAEEGSAVLGTVLAYLRKRLDAAAVACVSADGVLLALEGGRFQSRMAERVLAAGQPILPHVCDGSIEGGAPVRYGGDAIAVLVGRWVLGASPGSAADRSRAALTVTLAATAIGPVVAEALARGRASAVPALGEILGVSSAMAGVRRSVERAAAAPFAVLVEGESGCGKELVARALHRLGPRRDRPFCSINCAALPDDLVESELFGHARGAFTGAVIERPGVFEEAHTGTLFLDEIGELSPRAQAKVLRTIQEGELRRVGENVARRVDVRIVAATNRDLRREAASGRFRVDLLYRLDVVRITVPPLRDRRDDIALLADRYWQEAAARVGSRATLAASTMAALAAYDWPGNVRELQNVLAALAVRSPRRGVIPPTALPPPFAAAPSVESWRLEDARRVFEEQFVRAALVRTAGHRTQAAEQLGVTRQGLTKLMVRLGIAE